jgi:hypothetical protein
MKCTSKLLRIIILRKKADRQNNVNLYEQKNMCTMCNERINKMKMFYIESIFKSRLLYLNKKTIKKNLEPVYFNFF